MKNRQPEMKQEISMTELISAIREGDQEAFAILYEKTSQDVYRTARAILRDEEAALDVQQDTYVFAYNHLDQLKDPEKVLPWLRAIAVNRAKSVLRQQTPILFTELENEEGEGMPEQADLSPEASPELQLERKETAELVSEILSGLSDGQRAAVSMYYYEQMSVGEIAEALGVSPSTVKCQLIRGRKKIEEAVRALEKKGVKLYGLSPLPFLLALMKGQALAAQQGEAVLVKTMTKAGFSAGAKTAAAAGAKAAAAGAAKPVAVHVGRGFFETAVGKLLAGALAVGLVGGGIWAGAKLLDRPEPAPYQPTETVERVQLANHDSGEDLNESLPVEEQNQQTETTEPTAEPTAEQNMYAGTCGENLTWAFDPKEGTLTISGSGDMTDYPDAESVPWHSYRGEIKKTVFPDEMTGIGDYAFADCVLLDHTAMWKNDGYGCPFDNVTRIGNHAFAGCVGMDFLDLGEKTAVVGEEAFAGCPGVRAVSFPTENEVSIGRDAFKGSGLCVVFLPNSFTSVEEKTFTQCASLERITLPESLNSVADSAFTGCAALREVWILNRDCKLTAKSIQGAPSELTVCGFPGSTAEQFAQENGYVFTPIEENRDEILALMKQGLAGPYETSDWSLPEEERTVELYYLNPSLHYNGILPVGDQYVTQILRSEHVSATEEAIQQAKQTGTIVLHGKEYAYTESEEQAKEWAGYNSEWGDRWEECYTAEAWISGSEQDEFYLVSREDDGYYFRLAEYYGGVDGYLNSYTPVGWLLLDADTPAFDIGERCTMPEYTERCGTAPGSGSYVEQLCLYGEDNLALFWASAGH